MAAYIHYGSATHHPMLTVSAKGTVADVCRKVREAIREGTPVKVQIEDVVLDGSAFLRKFGRWTGTGKKSHRYR